MSEDSIYATRRLDPDSEDAGLSGEEVAEGATIITPPPLPESEAVVTPPPLPDIGLEEPPPLPEPEGVLITPPAVPEVVPEPLVIELPGRPEPEAMSALEIPSPFEEVEAVVAPESDIAAVPSLPVTPVAPSSGGGGQEVLPPGKPPKKDNTATIILIVVVALFFLCCCSVIVVGLVLMLVPESTWDTMYLLQGVLPLL